MTQASRQRGAVIVETVIAMLFYVACLAAIAMMSLAIFRYVLLTDIVSQALRQSSVDASAGYGSCSGINTDIEQTARAFLSEYGLDGDRADLAFTIATRKTSSAPDDCRSETTVTAEWEFPCFFCPWLSLPSALTVVQSRAIEDATFRRCGGCSTCPS